MNSWSEVPFVRLILPFIAGILCAVYLPLHPATLRFLVYPLLALYLLFLFYEKISQSFQYRWMHGLLITLAVFLIGIQLTLERTDRFLPSHFGKYLNEDSSLVFAAKLTEPLVEKENSYRAEVEVTRVFSQNQYFFCDGRAVVYFRKDEHASLLEYGDCILLKNKFKEIQPPQNPGEFDYRQYLSFNNIYHTAYFQAGDWKQLGRKEGNALFKFTYACRAKFFSVIRVHFPTEHELAVGSALVLGYMDYIDDRIISAYSSTGAMHVLSVSGLHVGIIFWVLKVLLSFLDKRGWWGRIFKTAFIVLFIWFFALVTGSSSSVVRAAIMLSFVVIGLSFQRNVNIYNTIAASAFFMLCWNPYFIMDVGFQLSYLAIIGLVSLHRMIYSLLFFRHWLADTIWEVTAVSLAAQLATFPVGLLYFHQFPNYFLISNLIVVPAAALILYLGIALLLLSKFSIAAYWAGKILYYSVFALNQVIFYIEKLPYSLVEGISISVAETWLIYGLLIGAIAFYSLKQPKFIFLSLAMAILVSFQSLYKGFLQSQQKKIIVYHIPGTSAIDIVDGAKNYFLADGSLIRDESKMLFHIKHNWWQMGIRRTELMPVGNVALNSFQTNASVKFIDENHLQFYDKRLLIADDIFCARLKNVKPHNKVNIDWLVLSKNPAIKIRELLSCYEAKEIVFDSSNSARRIKGWERECKELRVKCYSVKSGGAFIREW